MTGDLVGPQRRPRPGAARFPNGGSTSTLRDLQLARQPARRLPRAEPALRAAAEAGRRPRRRPGRRHAGRRRSTSPAIRGTTSTRCYKLSPAPACALLAGPAAAPASPTPGPWRCASKAGPEGWTAPATSRSTPKATSGSATTTPTAGGRGSRPVGRELFRFTPTGRYYPGSPYRGGGTQRRRLRHRDRPLRPRLGRQLRLRRQGLRERSRRHNSASE